MLIPLLVSQHVVSPLLLSVTSLCGEPAPAAGADLLALVPRDAVLVARVAPLDALRADVRANAWWQLATDPALAALWQRLGCDDDGFDCDLHGLEPRELCDAIHGQVAAYVASGSDLEDATFGVLVEPGGDGAAFDAFVAKLRAKAAPAALRIDAAHAGVPYELWTGRRAHGDDDAADGEHGDDGALAYVRTGGVAAFFVDAREEGARRAAHDLIVRVQSGSAATSIAAHAGLAEARRRAQGPARAELFLDLARVSQKIVGEADGDEERRWIRELGLGDMRWLHARCDFAAGENLDLEVALSLSPNGALTGWLGALHAPSRTMLAKVPGDCVGVSLTGFDVQRLWRDVWATFGRVDEAGSAAARAEIAQASQALGTLDLERDLIGQLTGEFASFTVEVPQEEAAGFFGAEPFGDQPGELLAHLPALGEVHVIGVREPLALAATLESIFGLFGLAESVDSEEVEGKEVSFVALGEHARFSWCFGSDCVMLSAHPTALRKALAHAARPDAPSAVSDPRFAQVLADNVDACSLSVASTPATLKAIGGALAYLVSMDDAQAGAALSEFDWQALVDRYLKGTTVCTLRHQAGELRVHLRTR